MATDIVPTLFGVTTDSYRQTQQDRADAKALQFAKLDPFEQANYAIGRGAYGLAGAVGGALGGQDPELQRITRAQQIAGQIDFNNDDSMTQGILELNNAGDPRSAMQLQQILLSQQAKRASIGKDEAAARASDAAATRDRTKAPPEKVQLARAVALLSGPVDSPEYNTAFATSLKEQVAPRVAPEGKTTIQKLQEYAKTLELGSTELAQVMAVIKAEGEGKATKVNVGVKLPAQEGKFEEGLGKGQAERILADQTVARDAAEILRTNQVGRDLLSSGAITGTGANLFVGLNNALAQAGLDFGYADAAANSQAYVAAMGANVGRIIKQFGAGTGLSNADREYAAKIAAGEIALTETALRRILNINDRAANRVIDLHNKNVKDVKTNIPLTVEKPTFAKPAPAAASQIPGQSPAPAAASAPMYATNGKERIMSTDGGKTWSPVR